VLLAILVIMASLAVVASDWLELEPDCEPSSPQATSAHAAAAHNRLLNIEQFSLGPSSNGEEYQEEICRLRTVAISGHRAANVELLSILGAAFVPGKSGPAAW
jgi:hypothetical protein